ncbi:FAD binding domain-containing protein [Spirosoma telluris]|uniref:FAD binding domain-containing protein n=1 Tax=Spirosoma telluris TaxID=2183553 RepID=UPI0038CD713E
MKQAILPPYFATIRERLHLLSISLNGELTNERPGAQRVGGGTDVYVQKHDEIKDASIQFLFDTAGLKGIEQAGNQCLIGPSTTVTDLMESSVMKTYFPDFKSYTKLVSSTPIRNMATIGGNFINASPIGDFTIFFLALDATLTFSDGNLSREVLLRDLYKGYKTLDKRQEDYLEQIRFDLPDKNTRFNFEKVSKRTHLDIASVNSAIRIAVQDDVITNVRLAAGGIAPIPKQLTKTAEFLTGKLVTEELIREAVAIAQTEIAPISDARGTEAYKRLLLSQLIKAHFIKLFPKLKVEQLIS